MNSNRAWWRWFSISLGVNTAIVLFNAILIGILWNAVFGLTRTERQDTIRAAIDRNDNLAIAFEQYTIRTIEGADAVVQHLIREYAHFSGEIDLTKWAADHTIDNKAIIGVVLADEHGNALSTAYSPNQAKQMNVADREHFRVHIERDSGRLFVGKPVVGRVSGQGVIPVTRRINKADGTFGGVAMALIEPGRFTDVLHDAKLRPLDIISLVGLDGITRARLRGTTASWGEDISNSPLFAERARHPNGNYFAAGQLDKVPRLYSYRTLPDYQVMTIVGTAEADVLAEFYRRQTQYFWAAGLTSVFIAGFAVLLMLALASQRRAAAAVVRSQSRILATFAQAAVGIAHSDLEGRYLEVNQKFCEILGYSREELLKRGFNDVTHPDDAQSITDSRRQLLAKPGEFTSLEREKRYIRKDGAIIWCSVTLSVVHDNTGQVEYVLAMIQDISDRKRAEEELRESQARFAILTGMSTDFYWESDTEHRLTARASANRKVSMVSAFQRGAQIGERRWEIPNLSPDEAGWQTHRALLDAHLPFRNFEISRLGADGAERHISISGDPVFDASGAFTGYRGIGTDITERKQIEIRINRLNRVYAVLSGINALIVRVHDRGEVFNEACRIVVEYGHFGLAWIGIFDPATQDVTPVSWAGEIAGELTRAKSSSRDDTPAGKGAVGRAIRERRPVFNNDIAAHGLGGPRMKEVLKLGFRSQLTLPFFENEAVVGTLTIYAREPNFFDEDELRLLTELAGNISFALGNISRQQKLDKLARIRAFSSEINAAIVRIRDRKALLEATCRIASEQGKFEMIWIGMVDVAKQEIRVAAWAGFSPEIAHRVSWKTMTAARGTLTEAILTRKPSVRNDIETELLTGGMRSEALALGCGSTACLPLVVNDNVVALIALYGPGTGFFDEEELALLNEVAANISFALEHIEKEEKIAGLSRIQAVLGRIDALIVRTRDRDELFREACRIAIEEGGFRMALIAIVDQSTMKIVPVASAGKDEELLTAIKGVLSSSKGMPTTMVARAMREKKAVVSNDSQNDPQVLFGKLYADSGVRSMAVLPLIVSDEAMGVLALYSEETGFFDEEELKLLAELCGDIAFAIDHIDKQARLDYLAYYDALTGLANRRLFLERVAQFMRSAATSGHKLALFLFDLERFKNINDSLGRPAGDALLKQVAEWLTRNAGDANLFARIDADHFAIVLPEVKSDGDVSRLVEKTSAAFLEHPFRLNDAVFRIAVKVGAALFPDDGGDADTLFRNAEAALKKAKASGERYLFYTQKMTETVAGNLTLENQLRRALDNEEFVLHYQPKVSLVSGKMTSVEALIRWNDPRTGLVPPGKFIPVLEETGLIYEAGRWALKKAIGDYLRWRAAGLPAVRIAVNVSPLQLRNRGFVDEIGQVIGIDAHAPAGLELEITESLIMEDVRHNIASLQAIRAMDVTIAIDDFGTGFSSLSYLAKLPVDTLKIDNSFVLGMTAGPEGLALVSTFINLAHSLKLKVVAEGVETEEQSRLLRLLSCEEMQGNLFSKPVPGEIFETRFLALPPAG
ncbi:MAG: EAL domain-containing protein [Burkholderiales bacterium]|nr:EAL domain-containing protein [Burkholderiales bacterium]